MHSYFFVILSVLLFTSCKSSEETQKSTAASSSYWQLFTGDLPQNANFPSHYQIYFLNEIEFKQALSQGSVLLPSPEAELVLHSVKENQVMAPELAAKFPEIKSYEGQEIGNSLCTNRINVKNEKIDIAVFCNNLTYYIEQYETNDKTYYLVFNKKQAPPGAGTVNE